MFSTQASSLYSLTVVNGNDHNGNGTQSTSVYHFGDNETEFQRTLNNLNNGSSNQQSSTQSGNLSINNTQIFTSISNVLNVQGPQTVINNYGTINNNVGNNYGTAIGSNFSPNVASPVSVGQPFQIPGYSQQEPTSFVNLEDILNNFDPDKNIKDNINAEEGLTNRQKKIISRFAIQLRKADGSLNEQDSNIIDLVIRMVKGNNEAGIRPEIDRAAIKEHRFELRQARREFKSVDISNPDYENKLKNYKNLLTDMMSLKLFGNKLQEAHNMALQNEKFEAYRIDSLVVANNYSLNQNPSDNTTTLGNGLISEYLNTDEIINNITNNINNSNLS